MIHIATARLPRFLVGLAPLVVALAACESTGPGTRALSLSVTTKSATSTSMASATADPSGGALSPSPTPITVGPGTTNFTVSVDVASWFKDASGAFLDPNDPANAETINANIRHSFRAFADEDHDGVDDDHEER